MADPVGRQVEADDVLWWGTSQTSFQHFGDADDVAVGLGWRNKSTCMYVYVSECVDGPDTVVVNVRKIIYI